jgi:hypothetical protein
LAYIAMEYVDGPTLDQLLSEQQAVTPEQMFSILGQTAVALDYAHQKGIVHRDIKPANIMIARDGTVKITDFGIAKVTASEQFTMTGAIVGTPHYMSPEQVQGQPVDGRSDQFSLAVIAYEMLTGEKPYTGENLTTVVYKIVAEEPAPPHRLNPTLGGAIEVAMRKGMAKKPDARYRVCQEFAETLEKACQATVGWKAMPRSGGLNEPTIAEVKKPAIVLPPSRRRLEATGTTERGGQRKSGFLTFLLAMLVVTGLLALIGWQAAPWLLKPTAHNPDADTAKPAATHAAQPAPAATAAENPNSGEGKPAAPALSDAKPAESKPDESKPADANAGGRKPSPMPPVAPIVAAKPPEPDPVAKRSPPVRRPAEPQPITVISSPGGAKATLDGNSGTTCTTPCTIDAAPGRHTLVISMPGFQLERREVDVGSSPQEIPAIVLRAQGGTLWLTSTPSGAAVLVDGKRTSHVTPAQVPLAPGTYKITVEKDGKQATQTVEVRSGISYLKILFDY